MRSLVVLLALVSALITLSAQMTEPYVHSNAQTSTNNHDWAQLIPNRLDEGNQGSLSAHAHSTDQQATGTGMIDGSQHPEMIPDSIAYRLYFTTASLPSNPTAEQMQLQIAQLGMIGLNASDTKAVMETLAAFRVQFDSLVADYNSSADRGEANVELFTLQMELLVANTRGALKASLSAEGMALFDAYVQAEKQHMQIAFGKTD